MSVCNETVYCIIENSRIQKKKEVGTVSYGVREHKKFPRGRSRFREVS